MQAAISGTKQTQNPLLQDWNTCKGTRLNPLSILLINFFQPLVNTLFPAQHSTLFAIASAWLVVLMAGYGKRAMKILAALAAFGGLYLLNMHYLHSSIVGSSLRMLVLFISCIIYASLLVSDYNSSEILSALQKLHLPKTLIIALTVTIRYIPTFRQEFRTIREAMQIRGVKFSVAHPGRTFEYLIVPQLFRCLSLSSELTAAALTKGVSSTKARTSYFARPLRAYDYVVFAVLILGHGLIIGGFL